MAGSLAEAARVDYIDAADLAARLRAGETTLRVVDVRDDDFAGGHIPGAVNRPAENFADDDDVDQFVQDVAGEGVQTVVFHCMMSQVRGPHCARRFNNRVQAAEMDSPLQTLILRFGFSGWVRQYRGTDLVEDYDANMWE